MAGTIVRDDVTCQPRVPTVASHRANLQLCTTVQCPQFNLWSLMAAEPMLVNFAEVSGNSEAFVMFVYCTLLKSTTNNITYLHSYEHRLAVY
jgi:hypothetical protein